MLISTKGRYALRVMTDLAEHPTEGYVPLKGIAQRQEISEKYLEAIIKILVKSRLLAGVRGKGGGYKLTRWGNSSVDRGLSGPRCLPGGGCRGLPQSSGVPHTACLEGLG